MATIPTPRTWITDEFVDAALLNNHVRDPFNFLIDAPAAGVFNSADFVVANNTETAITFDSERWDNDAIHSTSVNPSRLTCVTAGVYNISGCIVWTANATGVRTASLRLNGGSPIARKSITSNTAAFDAEMPIATQWKLGVGDYIELVGFQTSGGNLNARAIAPLSPQIAMTWMSRG